MYLLIVFGVNVIFNKELISSSYLKIWFLFVFLMIFMKNNNKKYNKFKNIIVLTIVYEILFFWKFVMLMIFYLIEK